MTTDLVSNGLRFSRYTHWLHSRSCYDWSPGNRDALNLIKYCSISPKSFLASVPLFGMLGTIGHVY